MPEPYQYSSRTHAQLWSHSPQLDKLAIERLHALVPASCVPGLPCDSSMSANAALWDAIEQGLRESEWLVLLASPEAACREYVNKELSWWVPTRNRAEY